MLKDGEGLKSGIKFAVGAAYDRFAAAWDMPADKLGWIDTWSSILEGYEVADISAVVEHCVGRFRRQPVPAEFLELIRRKLSGEALDNPLVSKIERLAMKLLDEKALSSECESLSELSDVCLIAAAVAHLKSYEELLPAVGAEGVSSEFIGRARMFADAALEWKQDASEGRGFWKIKLGKSES